MEYYNLRLDENVSVWYRHFLSVKAENEQEAVKKIAEKVKEEDPLDTLDWGDDIIEDSGEYLYDTAETIRESVRSTIEVYREWGYDEEVLWDNKSDGRNFKIVVLDKSKGRVDVIKTYKSFVEQFGGVEEFLAKYCKYSLSNINYLAGNIDIDLNLTERSFK